MPYNIIVKSDSKYKFIIYDMIATNLNKNEFEKIKSANMDLLGEYDFIPFKNTDFSWWQSITRFLTKNRLYRNVYFDIDFFGNVKKYR